MLRPFCREELRLRALSAHSEAQNLFWSWMRRAGDSYQAARNPKTGLNNRLYREYSRAITLSYGWVRCISVR